MGCLLPPHRHWFSGQDGGPALAYRCSTRGVVLSGFDNPSASLPDPIREGPHETLVSTKAAV
jgi:hypothetical protein